MLRGLLKEETKAQPYTQLALIYDYVMRHVQYGKWAAYLAGMFKKTKLDVRTVLDISCGTGSLLLELSRRGFQGCGFDRSHEMIRIAKKKVELEKRSLSVWCGAMQQFSVSGQYDAVVSNYDSLNYCMNIESCLQVFDNAAAALKNEGMFIFDICTEKNSNRHFRNFFERDGTDEFEYIRQAYYNPVKHIQTNEFSIHWSTGDRKPHLEVHHQRIYKIAELRKSIPDRLFEVLGVYDGFSRQPGTEDSERVHFVLRKK